LTGQLYNGTRRVFAVAAFAVVTVEELIAISSTAARKTAAML
jgi:hypothetical protein